MQFPNRDAKVSVFSVYANEMEKKGMFYNIVLYFRANIYTCKHFEGLESEKNKPPKLRRGASMAVPFKHL